MDAHTCYVCGGTIREGALGIGQGLYRHPSKCEPGSEAYMQNPYLAARHLDLCGKEIGNMKAKDVVNGGVYVAKVSDKIAKVRIDAESPHGGWNGTNLDTGKSVRIKSAQRLRGPAEGEVNTEAPTAPPAAQGAKRPARKSKDASSKPAAKGGHTGGLDAVAKVLAEAGEPLNCKQIVERAFEKGYWKSDGKTPWATVYSAILREIQHKGAEARFRKAARGRFELAR
jgi:hypothetical protein